MPPRWRYAFRPLALRLRLMPAGVDCVATYRTAVLSPGRVTDLMRDYLDVLGALSADPDRRVLSGTAAIRQALRVQGTAGRAGSAEG